MLAIPVKFDGGPRTQLNASGDADASGDLLATLVTLDESVYTPTILSGSPEDCCGDIYSCGKLIATSVVFRVLVVFPLCADDRGGSASVLLMSFHGIAAVGDTGKFPTTGGRVLNSILGTGCVEGLLHELPFPEASSGYAAVMFNEAEGKVEEVALPAVFSLSCPPFDGDADGVDHTVRVASL